MTGENSHTTSFSYDAFGRITQTSFPSNYYETYAGVYPERSRGNAVGNLISKTARAKQSSMSMTCLIGLPKRAAGELSWSLAAKQL